MAASPISAHWSNNPLTGKGRGFAEQLHCVGSAWEDVRDEVPDIQRGISGKAVGDLLHRPSQCVLRRIGVSPFEGDEDADRDFERGRIASSGVEGRPQVAEPLPQLIGLIRMAVPGGVPLVGVAGDELKHAWLLAGDQDGGSALPNGERPKLRVGRMVVRARVGHPTVAQQGHHDLEPFVEPRDAMVEGIAEGVEFRLVPAAAEAENEPAAADLVQFGGHLGGEGGVTEGKREHQRSNLDTRRHGGDRGEHGPALVDAGRLSFVAEDEVVGTPHRVEPVLLGRHRQRAQIREASRLIGPEGQHQSDLHGVNASGARANASSTVSGMIKQLPLEGIRVIDVSRVLAGPFATMLLADLGADVIKIEPPGGDETRSWGPPWWGDAADRRSAYFASVNRNKRSVVLDLRVVADRATLERLLATADLIVHNYRPTTAARLGLETDALRARHPRLVVASIGGFPGADADRPAYDLLAQAVSGLMSVTGVPDGPATKTGVALLDLLAGLECAIGALAALVGRGRVGAVEVSLVEAGVTSLINVLGNHLASGDEPGRHGNAHPNIVPYQVFAAADADLAIAVGNDAQFGRLLDVLHLTDDGRYADNSLRLAHRAEVVAWLAGAVGLRDRDELIAALEAADVPAGPVNRVSEALASMEVAHENAWTQTLDGVRMAPSPVRVDGARLLARLPPPRLGEHTEVVLGDLH